MTKLALNQTEIRNDNTLSLDAEVLADLEDNPRRNALSRLLRGLGGLIIVAAFVLYLFEGWRESDDLSRALLLLGHTLALTLAGLASGHWLHENKGARLFIALALAAVPVNVAFLGGLTYPVLSGDGATDQLSAATSIWLQSQGRLTLGPALALSAGSLFVLTLSVWLGFRVMARHSVAGLTGLYLVGNAALLVPTRGEAMISVLLVGLTVMLALFSPRLRRRDPALATPEGRLARTVLVLPVLILAGRSLWLYAPDLLFLTTLSLLGYLALRFTLITLGSEHPGRGWVETLALTLAVMVTGLASGALHSVWPLADEVQWPLRAALLAIALLDLAQITPRRAVGYHSTAVIMIDLSVLLDLVLYAGFTLALLALVVGIATLGFGYRQRSRASFGVGVITTLAGLSILADEALAQFSLGSWSALVVLGIGMIIVGSALERCGERLKTDLAGWRAHFHQTR